MAHPSLPKGLTPEILSNWIRQNSKESFSEEKKIYYTDDELQDFKNEAVNCGIEINGLKKLKKSLALRIDKGSGSDGDVNYTIPGTLGIKALVNKREALESEIETGYRVETVKIYGIPNHDTQMMDFFDIEGNEIPERSRSLSAKEIRDYIGLFAVAYQESKQA